MGTVTKEVELQLPIRDRKYIYSVRQKVSPNFFAIFLTTACNFYMKFHTFIAHS